MASGARLIAFLLLVSVSAFGQDTPGDKELEKVQGRWNLVGFMERGEEIKLDEKKKTWFVDFKSYSMLIGIPGITASPAEGLVATKIDGPSAGVAEVKLDGTKAPKTVDLIMIRDKKLVIARGIYKIEGESLTVCFGKKRPSDFSAANKDNQEQRFILLRGKK